MGTNVSMPGSLVRIRQESKHNGNYWDNKYLWFKYVKITNTRCLSCELCSLRPCQEAFLLLWKGPGVSRPFLWRARQEAFDALWTTGSLSQVSSSVIVVNKQPQTICEWVQLCVPVNLMHTEIWISCTICHDVSFFWFECKKHFWHRAM